MSDEPAWPLDPDDGIPERWEVAFQTIASANGPPHAQVARAEALMLLDRMRWQRHIFQAQAERASREANDAMQRHQEAQDTARANAQAADAQATAANNHAAALKVATMWLSISTGVLAVATVVLVIVTARNGG